MADCTGSREEVTQRFETIKPSHAAGPGAAVRACTRRQHCSFNALGEPPFVRGASADYKRWLGEWGSSSFHCGTSLPDFLTLLVPIGYRHGS